MLLTERCQPKENIIYNNRGNQNFLNKERWYHRKATSGTPYFCAGYSLWGFHTELIASLPMRKPSSWSGQVL